MAGPAAGRLTRSIHRLLHDTPGPRWCPNDGPGQHSLCGHKYAVKQVTRKNNVRMAVYIIEANNRVDPLSPALLSMASIDTSNRGDAL